MPARFLLVDDEDAVLRSLRRFLARDGFEVEVATSAELALEILEGGFVPHVIISDFRMPGVDGVMFLREVRERWPRVQRVLMTGFADIQAIESAINDSKIYRFVAKPWDEAGLLATVRSAVEQWELEEENMHLQQLTQEQNRQLVAANRDLEGKINERTSALSRAKREWEVAFDAIVEPLMIVDRDFRIVRANLALAAHFGREIRQVPGNACHELRASSPHRLPRGEDGSCVGCPVKEARSKGNAVLVELETTSERTYSLGAFPFPDDEVRGGVVCRYQDLTEQRAMARQLAQADKLAAMGLLAGGVAHEINNPLGAILAFAQLLRREIVEPEERDDYMREIEESAVRCKEIVERLLRFARQAKRDERRACSFNDVVLEASFLIEKSYLKSGVTLVRDLAPDLWPISGNANELSQVLLNLITNARDAMPSGGTIRVRTRNLEADNAVELWVADTGEGMPPNVVKRIFDPFFTTKEEGKGTGLGLAVSYGIVRDHRGRITVRSRPGEGTEFSVVLPRLERPEAPPADA
ncbi:MAG: response regulator [Deltaproteobacteria bacterium]|nr:response regulator [Deltaproteobacteria bacterium]